jgi:hypothetical protein
MLILATTILSWSGDMKNRMALVIAAFCFSILTGCTHSPADRVKIAVSIAQKGGMIARPIIATPFMLTLFERIQAPGQEADVYIEGDGLAWIGHNLKSPDPTPTDPIALRLAAVDPADNVIYLARPCQYSKMADSTQPCSSDYWTKKRFAPEVLDAMNKALDDIKKDKNISGYHLIGYSGGGGVGALLTAQRHDILSLRTVAGNLDHVLLTQNHHVSPMEGSLNPRDFAQKTRAVPQLHFIGGDDAIITPDIYQSFAAAAGATSCIHKVLIESASHESGWVEHWPQLLQQPVTCNP